MHMMLSMLIATWELRVYFKILRWNSHIFSHIELQELKFSENLIWVALTIFLNNPPSCKTQILSKWPRKLFLSFQSIQKVIQKNNGIMPPLKIIAPCIINSSLAKNGSPCRKNTLHSCETSLPRPRLHDWFTITQSMHQGFWVQMG